MDKAKARELLSFHFAIMRIIGMGSNKREQRLDDGLNICQLIQYFKGKR